MKTRAVAILSVFFGLSALAAASFAFAGQLRGADFDHLLPSKAPVGPPTAAKSVYLTFDADMNPHMLAELRDGRVKAWYDRKVFDLLKSENIKATFFVTGLFAETYPDLVSTLAREGNAIGNHSYSHPAFSVPCYGLPAVAGDAKKIEEIAKTQKILAKLTGATPKLFRFPGLCHARHDLDLVRSLGLATDDPTIVSGDAFARSADAVARRIVDQARDGSVILMHVGGPNAPATAEALKKAVAGLQARGFEFKKL